MKNQMIMAIAEYIFIDFLVCLTSAIFKCGINDIRFWLLFMPVTIPSALRMFKKIDMYWDWKKSMRKMESWK